MLPAAPMLSAPASLTVNEDGTVALSIVETPFSANDTVSITIAGVPADATLSAGINNGNGSWTLTPAQLSGLTLTAGEVGTATNLTVTATNTAGQTASATTAIALNVTSVAPTLAIATSTLAVNEDGTVALGITETPFNSRDSVSITIAGVPADATLSAGTNNGNGTWTLTPAQLARLILTAGEVTTANLTVTAHDTRRLDSLDQRNHRAHRQPGGADIGRAVDAHGQRQRQHRAGHHRDRVRSARHGIDHHRMPAAIHVGRDQDGQQATGR